MGVMQVILATNYQAYPALKLYEKTGYKKELMELYDFTGYFT